MIFTVLLILPLINAHLILNENYVWGIDDGTSLEEPLTMDTNNWICAGKTPEENGVMTFQAGKTYNLLTTCGEKVLDSDGCSSSDWHLNDQLNDFSGCVLGVNYNNYKNVNDWKYIAYQKDCAKRGSLNAFTIADNVESITKGICSWGWIPSIDHSTPQAYMNCFYCNIIGNGNKNTMANMEFANVPGAKYNEKVYNDFVNPNDIYDVIPKNKITSTKKLSMTRTRTFKHTSSPKPKKLRHKRKKKSNC